MIDVHGRAGDFGLGPLPAVPGMEAAGIVLDVGPGVAHLAPGDRVVYAGRPPGAYAEVRTMPAASGRPLPPDIDDATAAAVLPQGHHGRPAAARRASAQAGETRAGPCRGGRPRPAALRLGARARRDRHRRRVSATTKWLRPATPAARPSSSRPARSSRRPWARSRPAAASTSSTTGSAATTFDASLASLAPRGHLVSFGQVSGPLGARDLDALSGRSIRLSRPNFADYAGDSRGLHRRADRVFEAVRAGILKPRIDSRLAALPRRRGAPAARKPRNHRLRAAHSRAGVKAPSFRSTSRPARMASMAPLAARS